MHSRKCPNCDAEIKYKRKDTFDIGNKHETWCKNCSVLSYTRKCPKCNKTIKHPNRKNFILNKDKTCRPCSYKNRSQKYKGNGNPFYGKTHSEETKKKISLQDQSFKRSETFKKRRRETSKSGPDNPMFGTSVYKIWIQKHGKDIADAKMKKAKAKWSKASSGKNNPMYGKPAPQGSGNGWKGWYNGAFFRSLKELSYIVKVLEKEKLIWRSAETKDLTIPYIDYDGTEKTYRADFLVEEKTLVEIKPIKLQETLKVKRKEEAAILFCKENGYEYLLIDPDPLSDEEITNLIKNKKVVFMEKYISKYKERYEE